MAAAEGNAKSSEGRIRLEVVTPSGLVLSEMVDEFTAPSVQGEFGVLPGHLPILAALRIGLLRYRIGQTTTACALGQGFVEVADDYALVLTDQFLTKDKIDVVATRMRFKELDEKLSSWSDDPGTPKHQQVIADEQWQAAVLELFGDPPPPTIRVYESFVGEDKSNDLPQDPSQGDADA